MQKIEIVSKANTRYLRVSPRKVRVVIDQIRGKKVTQALALLPILKKQAKYFVEKSLKSALSNAKLNPAIRAEELFISKITADNGPMLKRYRARAMGRATMIRHRTTHLTIELARVKKKTLKPVKKRARQRH